MKKIIPEYLQECTNFGVKKFDLKYNIVELLHTLFNRADQKEIKIFPKFFLLIYNFDVDSMTYMCLIFYIVLGLDFL